MSLVNFSASTPLRYRSKGSLPLTKSTSDDSTPEVTILGSFKARTDGIVPSMRRKMEVPHLPVPPINNIFDGEANSIFPINLNLW